MNVFKKFYLLLLFHQRKYDEILKKTVFSLNRNIDRIDSDSIRFQGLCSIFQKNFYHAKLCFELLDEKGTANSRDYTTLAFLYSRHNDKEKVLLTLCKALKINKNNNLAQKTLDYIKQKGRELNIGEDPFFDKLLPKEPFLIPLTLILKILIIIALLVPFSYFSYKGILYFYSKYSKLKIREDITKVYLPDYNPNLLEKPKDITEKYSYNENEIKDKFEKIKSLILSNNVVDAQIHINEIKLSNASLAVKSKVEILESFIEEPDYATFKNKIDFDTFIKKREIYNNIYIKWHGRIINKSLYKDKIAFDLVIGDEEKGLINAIIPVIFGKAVIIENNDKATIFGKIIIEDKIYIDGKYLIKDIKN